MFQIIDSNRSLEVEKDQNDFVVVVPFAMCNESNRIISIDSRLSFINDFEIQLEDGLIMEFSFEITVLSLDATRQTFSTQDRNVVGQYLNLSQRSKIIGIVCESAKSLVMGANPDRIYRVTKSPNLPAKALKNTIC